MEERKIIKVHKGDKKKIAIMCGVTVRTVYNALHWHSDTSKENEIRECAKKYFENSVDYYMDRGRIVGKPSKLIKLNNFTF